MKYLSLILIFIFSTYSSTIAQPGMEPPPVEGPITDYIGVLVAAALLFGTYTIIRNKKKSEIKKLSKKSN